MDELSIQQAGIYGILHVASGRIYIGSAVSIRKRWHAHRRALRAGRHHSRFLQRVWTKTGEASFQFVVVERITKIETLVSREQWWIDKFQSARPANGFNTVPTAGSQLGYQHTDATKKKMSEARAKQTMSLERVEKARVANTGKKRSPEFCIAVGNRRRGVKASPETVEKMRAANIGKKLSREFCAMMSAARKGKPHTPRQSAFRQTAEYKARNEENLRKAGAIRWQKARERRGQFDLF